LQPFPPNPNPASLGPIYLPYRVAVNATVTIKAYDVSGELVRALDPHLASAGMVEQSWDLRNSAGQPVASGVYLLRFTATDDGGEKVQAWVKCAVVR
jgi:flagellar hook assembly protein FlgD